ncbi:Tm-1-like ATP-binding domain-containing protein [Paenibacillus frigoriresistens]|uniref:Tm-1-like ATP-binding domain-containing protein n=1 Tax=Paenibacillus alginolyticus TaxID=59839 RepID=UPI001563ED40|nr:Tm-1-like ATP-binding domain-containing protein [Paenibacillus frigoriresistens]NRF95908.1 Tm-1-like ATP-binding domain-containing protein [Paenibacillus frigoriresistens]
MATVVFIGTLDTKGNEYKFVIDRVKSIGCETILIDVGVLNSPQISADITREDVARAAGTEIETLIERNDRGFAIEQMAVGASSMVRKLFQEGRLHGVLALGGSGGSSIATQAMRALPIGVPKLMVSTIASGDIGSYIGQSDITMMYSVVDIAGINSISERILSNAASAISGMALTISSYTPKKQEKPLVAISMFGVTTPCVSQAREWLEASGYEVLVFHANGSGGRAMEGLMNDGFICATLDLTTTELADELVGGMLSAGQERLEVAGNLGIPQVVSLGALDIVNFGLFDTVPARFKSRTLYKHNPNVTLMRTTADECAELGKIIGLKLNKATGPVSVFIPLKGTSSIAKEGEVFYDAQADRALIDNLKNTLDPRIEVIIMDTDINDPEFAQAMARKLDELIKHSEVLSDE